MLYDGSLRFMAAGKHAMQKRDVFAQNDNITKAQRILSELLSTLDLEQGGEVASNLMSIYTYVYDRLVEANIEDKPETDRKSTRLNSSHVEISYAVFCLKKKKKQN